MNKETIKSAAGTMPGGVRLLFPEGRQAEFWNSVNASGEHQAYIREIREEGERLLRLPIPELTYSLFTMFERMGSRLEYEKVYFERRRRLTTMALLCCLEPDDEKYREALEDILWSICNEYTWCLPAHLKNSVELDGGQSFSVDSPEWSRRERNTRIDLFAAETGFALSEILRLTESLLPSLLRSRIEEEVVQRIFKPYLLHGPYHWETATHNWASVCAGSIASAALHLLDNTDQLATIIEKALATMDHYFSGFGEDGACLEGIGYWNYGFGFFVYFADLLKKRTQGRIDLFRIDKVRRIALFQQKSYLDGDIAVNFSDCLQHANIQIGHTHYLANIYADMAVPPLRQRAPYAEDHCSRWAPAFRNLLWLDPGRNGPIWEAADYYLDDAQWIVSRHVTSSGRYGFAAKGGHNNEPHNHNDIGQFILTGNGQVYISDLGSGEYTDRYFGPERYTYDCNGSQGHSVPIVDGQYQQAGAASAAQNLQATLGELEDRLEFDYAHAYRLPHLSALTRRLTWHKTDTPVLVLVDNFIFSKAPGSIVERIVTPIEPKHEEGSKLTLAGEGESKLAIGFDERLVSPRISSHTYRDHFGKDTSWYAIDFTVRQPGLENKVELLFQFG